MFISVIIFVPGWSNGMMPVPYPGTPGFLTTWQELGRGTVLCKARGHVVRQEAKEIQRLSSFLLYKLLRVGTERP